MSGKSRSKKYGSGLLKGWDERQTLGWERSTQKNIIRMEKEIKKLEDRISPLANKLNLKKKELLEYQETLQEVHEYMDEFNLVQHPDKIKVYIIKNDKRVRGKVYFYRKWRWFHICMRPEYDESQKDYYINMTRKKFMDSLKKSPNKKK